LWICSPRRLEFITMVNSLVPVVGHARICDPIATGALQQRPARGRWPWALRPAARSHSTTAHRPKSVILARLKEIIRAVPFFFCVCWNGTSKQHFRPKNFAPRSWKLVAPLVVLLSDCKRQSSNRATHGGTFYPHPWLLSSDFSRRVLSSKHCGSVWRQAQLTDAIGLSGAAVVEKYYVAHLACCLVQCNLVLVLQASARLARD
jgi:hypothetical protein